MECAQVENLRDISDQMPELQQAAATAEVVPSNYFERLDLQAIYGRMAPLEVDLGCGDGRFLADLAESSPESDFLGIERLRGRVRKTHGRIMRLGLRNMRVLWIETSYAVRYLLPPESVTAFHLMFPDPWPKRRHHRRRLFSSTFLESIHHALVPNGRLRVATDELDYFLQIDRLVEESRKFIRIRSQEQSQTESTFERRVRDRGLIIHSLVLQKV